MPDAPTGWPLAFSPPEVVYGAVAVQGGAAFVYGPGALPRREEAQVLAGHDLGDGEAIVDFRQVDVVGGNSGHLVGLAGGFLGGREGCQFLGVVQGFARGLTDAGQGHRTVGEVVGDVGRDQ